MVKLGLGVMMVRKRTAVSVRNLFRQPENTLILESKGRSAVVTIDKKG